MWYLQKRDCWVALPHSPGCLSISVSPFDSYCLFCIKWEFLLWTQVPHMKDWYWTCGSKVDWALNVLHLWQSSARVWLYLFKHSLHFQRSKLDTVAEEQSRRSWWNCRPPLHPTKLFVYLFVCFPVTARGCVTLEWCRAVVTRWLRCMGRRACRISVCWLDLALKKKKKHFLLCVWVLRSVTSGSKVDFLQDPSSGLSYSTVDCVRCGLARTLLSSIKKMYLSVHVCVSESDWRQEAARPDGNLCHPTPPGALRHTDTLTNTRRYETHTHTHTYTHTSVW